MPPGTEPQKTWFMLSEIWNIILFARVSSFMGPPGIYLWYNFMQELISFMGYSRGGKKPVWDQTILHYFCRAILLGS